MKLLSTITPELVKRPAQWNVFIPVEASFREWNNAISVIPELFGWIEVNGVTPSGRLFFRYKVLGDMDSQFQLEIGIATAERVTGDSRVQAGEIPGGTYATYVHHGHPDQLFQVCAGMEAWAAEQGIEFDIRNSGGRDVWVGRYEFYLTDPDAEPDRNNWKTEVAWKVKD